MKKHWKYLLYLLRHKRFVLGACIHMGIPWQGIIHDLSKFRPSEWFPYVEYFYGGHDPANIPAKVQQRFDAAWLAHIHRNPHHHQHWVIRYDDGRVEALKMPHRYTVEMLCDWYGAGMAIHGRKDIWEWYEKNKGHIILHPDTEWEVKRLGWYLGEKEELRHG